jgi:hypothetical protein
MKKIIFSVLFVLALVMVVTPAFALDCKNGNYGSDECWTTVKVASAETTVVIPGTVLVYDFSSVVADSNNSADQAAWTVRVSSAITDGYKIAGIAQTKIATGDRGIIMVRGQGKVRIATASASGDRLYASSTAGALDDTNSVDVASAASRDRAIAIHLATSTAAATDDAYIVIV